MARRWLVIAAVLVTLVAVIAAVGLWWLNDLPDPMPEAEAALVSSEDLLVESDSWLTFTPAEASDTGFIFYPGGRVPAVAYAPPVRAIAEAGYTSVITPMPFGLAVLAPDAADAVIEAYPEIEHWVIGGHSLGGAMAAQHVAGTDGIDGLVLWAAYPPGGTDLRDSDAVVASIHGSEDGLATPDEIEASAAQLPADTVFVELEGGNHAQFGWYGPQDGDGEATISREEQQARIIEATLEVLEAVGGPETDEPA